MVRAPFYDKSGLKKGAWSKEEDERLRAFVQKYGHSNWRQLPKFAGLARCGKSCRLRWLNYLRPNLKHGNYTQEEEKLIIKLHHQLGNRWSQIAEKLPGRTDNEIKNYWHSHLKKTQNSNEITTSSELKSKPDNILKVETANQFTEPESPAGSDGGANFHHVLESSLIVSTETSYTEEHNDSLTSINVAQSTMSYRKSNEDSAVPSVTFEEFSGDFWTEPFLVEGAYIDDEISGGDDGISFLIPYFYEGTDLFELCNMQELINRKL